MSFAAIRDLSAPEVIAWAAATCLNNAFSSSEVAKSLADVIGEPLTNNRIEAVECALNNAAENGLLTNVAATVRGCDWAITKTGRKVAAEVEIPTEHLEHFFFKRPTTLPPKSAPTQTAVQNIPDAIDCHDKPALNPGDKLRTLYLQCKSDYYTARFVQSVYNQWVHNGTVSHRQAETIEQISRFKSTYTAIRASDIVGGYTPLDERRPYEFGINKAPRLAEAGRGAGDVKRGAAPGEAKRGWAEAQRGWAENKTQGGELRAKRRSPMAAMKEAKREREIIIDEYYAIDKYLKLVITPKVGADIVNLMNAVFPNRSTSPAIMSLAYAGKSSRAARACVAAVVFGVPPSQVWQKLRENHPDETSDEWAAIKHHQNARELCPFVFATKFWSRKILKIILESSKLPPFGLY